ncbi:hypothetical protein L1887_39446 [Cichorium endivia]|nr:hypothetical protein L1887_39446 [Cichorium endivia]
MASSSSNKSCLHCHDSSSDCFSNGWKLRNGEYAQLCNRCSYEFNLGRFCEAFHSDEDGWRDCVSCGKIHIGKFSFSAGSLWMYCLTWRLFAA